MAYMRWNKWIATATTALLGTLGWTDVARADAVTDWQEIAGKTFCSGPATPPRSGPVGWLDMAITQIAVYDAVQNIGKKYKPYHTTIPGASGSPEAAAAKAAHDVLVAFYAPKAEELGKAYKEYFAKHGLKEDDPGVAVGQKAAAGIIALRADDKRVLNPAPSPWMGENAVGKWHPTPGRGKMEDGMAAPWLGEVKPFAIQSGTQFKPAKGPPALTSEEYTKDYNEVKAVGAKTNSTRTPEQTELANFWTTDSPAFCLAAMGVIREPVAAHVKDINESSRAIVLAAISVADAGITVWNTKRSQDHSWRPITAIHEADKDGNPATEPDPAWLPYLNTPPYSDWTSGANGLSGAISRSHTNFFGKDDVTFTITSTPDQKARTYNKLSDFAKDIENVRIYHGLHFRFADVAGREQGEKVADYVFKNVGTAK